MNMTKEEAIEILITNTMCDVEEDYDCHDCPVCSPYDYPNHFDRTYKKFVSTVYVYRCGLNYM